MNLKPRRREEPEINVVPLIDVVLLLVVFFMLSSRFMDEGRVRVQLPRASAPIATMSPMTAVILGWSVLGQSLSPLQIAGMGVVLGSVWLSQRAQQAPVLLTSPTAAR